jgi:hypothetical protein
MKRVASIRFVKPVKTVAPGTAPPVPDIFDGCFLSLDHRHHLPFTGRSHQPVVAVLADFIAGTIVWCAMIIEGCAKNGDKTFWKEEKIGPAA